MHYVDGRKISFDENNNIENDINELNLFSYFYEMINYLITYFSNSLQYVKVIKM